MEEMNDIEDELSPGARDLYRRVREAVWHMLCNTSPNHTTFTDLAAYQPVQVRVGLGRLEIQYNTDWDPSTPGGGVQLELLVTSPKGRSTKWVLRACLRHGGDRPTPAQALLQAQAVERCARFGLFAEEVFRGSSWTSKMVEEVRDIIGRRGLVLPGDYDCVVS